MERIHILGVGSDGLAGLTERARELLASADIVFGSDETLGSLAATCRRPWQP
jgi:precorrin-6B methylase 1